MQKNEIMLFETSDKLVTLPVNVGQHWRKNLMIELSQNLRQFKKRDYFPQIKI